MGEGSNKRDLSLLVLSELTQRNVCFLLYNCKQIHTNFKLKRSVPALICHIIYLPQYIFQNGRYSFENTT